MSVMVAEPECAMAYFDISAAEVRMSAYASEDEKLIELFNSGKDPYIYLIGKVFPTRVGEDAFVRYYRSLFKMVVLGLLYGRGAKSIATSIGVDLDEALSLIKSFHSEFTKVKPWIEQKQKFALENGYIDTFFGDKISCNVDRSYTTGINYFVQNCASIILAESFGNMIMESRKNGRPMNARIVVHDSCTISFHIKDLLDIYKDIKVNFQDYAKNKYGVYFKYDMIIHPLNHRDKVVFDYDESSGIINVKGFDKSVNYLRDVFKKYYNFEELECKEVTPTKSVIEDVTKYDETIKIQRFYVENNYMVPSTIKAKWKIYNKYEQKRDS